jgi:hypothetical protein
MKKIIFSFFLLFFSSGKLFANVTDPDCIHNLSANNSISGAVKATSETQVCKFCHIPHLRQPAGGLPFNQNLMSHTTTYTYYADAYGDSSFTNKQFRLPLISHQLTTAVNSARVSFSSGPPKYMYEEDESWAVRLSTWIYGPSSSFIWEKGPDDAWGDEVPTSEDDTFEKDWPSSGSSRVCFSCHDGTVKIGAVYNSTGTVSEINMTGGDLDTDGRLNTSDTTYPNPTPQRPGDNVPDFATRHSCEHAFYSFYMHQNVLDDVTANSRGLKALAVIRASGVLDRDDFVQCTACHDPHNGGSNTANSGKYFGGERQFWRKPGATFATGDPERVCCDCHIGDY